MKTAAQIMKRKRAFKDALDARLPKEQSDALWRRAQRRLDEFLKQYGGIPKGVHVHTDNFIFPAAAVYLSAKEQLPSERAYGLVESVSSARSDALGRKLAKLMKLPGLPGLFVRLWDPLCRKMFGESRGFQNVFYPKKKGKYRMDIVACPYCRYFTELGCPELTKVFCENDDRMYGSLPGLKFERKTTLGKGGERCDFYLERVST